MDLSHLKPGIAGTATATVDAGRTAKALGSGSEDVFGAPALAALMEAAAVACVEADLPDGCISLGTRLAIDHLAATPVGASVSARAELTAIAGRNLEFSVTAHDDTKQIGRGVHTRAVVERTKFLAKLTR
jgi:fluoroacetyl-CoA thioesterase